MYKDDLPRQDGCFSYNNLQIYICFRPYLKETLDLLNKIFEVIIWSTNQPDYTNAILNILDPSPRHYFAHVLDLSHCQKSENGSLSVKNLEVLTFNRKLENIIIIDCSM